jgi:plasmid stabilization system protein ParE
VAIVRYTDTAITDLEAIHQRFAPDSPRYADEWLDRIEEVIERLMKFPYSGKIIPELKLPDRREVLVGRYQIMDRIINDDLLEIMFVHHGKRRFPRKRNWP